MAELKINTIFPYKGKLYKVVKGTGCDNCAGHLNKICSELLNASLCSISRRSDGNSVYFLEIVKYRSTIPINSYRVISDMRIVAYLGEGCSNCVFNNTCLRNGAKGDFTFYPQEYFGNCAFNARNDDNNIIFKIEGNDTFYLNKSINDKFVNTSINIEEYIKSIQLNIPIGRVIDTDNSDFNRGIIAFMNKKYLSYSDIINNLGERAIIYKGNNEIISNTIKLINIIHYYNIYFKAKEPRKCTIKRGENTYFINFHNVPTHSPFVLLSKDAAYEIIDNLEFRDILDKVSSYN